MRALSAPRVSGRPCAPDLKGYHWLGYVYYAAFGCADRAHPQPPCAEGLPSIVMRHVQSHCKLMSLNLQKRPATAQQPESLC